MEYLRVAGAESGMTRDGADLSSVVTDLAPAR